MKKLVSILSLLVLVLSITVLSCSKKKDSQPCDNKGTLCIENKMDTLVTVNIMPVREQFNLEMDYIRCVDLEGNQPYTITISKPNYQWDTVLIVLPCDNKLLVVRLP
jgi:hypothetical protein